MRGARGPHCHTGGCGDPHSPHTGPVGGTWQSSPQPLSLLGQLGRLRLDEGNQVLVDEEDEAEAGNLGRGEQRVSGIGPLDPLGRPPTCIGAHLHYRVVVQLPLVATKHGAPVDVDGAPALISDEEITVILQLDDAWRRDTG